MDIYPTDDDYHFNQFEFPKESTKAFGNFLLDELKNSELVLDLGCGAGAASTYFALKNPSTKFIGIDISEKLVSYASEKSNQPNLTFEQGDWLDLQHSLRNKSLNLNEVDGVISLQTLSWLPDMYEPLMNIFHHVGPNWIGISSLFYTGDISCQVEIIEHKRTRRSFYNTYSLKELARLSKQYGYELSRYEKFLMPVDLEKPTDEDRMGTYTLAVSAASGVSRIQISGPLLMNWYFVLLLKC